MKWLVAIKEFFRLLSLVKSLVGLANASLDYLKAIFRKEIQKQEIKKVEKAENQLSEANKIVDDQERLRKKAEAACEIEKTLNPDSDCR